MRYTDLIVHEATTENIDILKKLGNSIWKDLPGVPYGVVKKIYLSQMPSFDALYQQYRDHKKFAPVFQVLETTRIHLINDDRYVDRWHHNSTDIWGYHSSSENLLLLWINNIAKQVESTNMRQAVFTTLVHELRHLFQYALYPQYWQDHKAFKKPYEERDIEIDAVWSQILSSIVDVADYKNNAESFLTIVMRALMSEKKLNQKQITHYGRKTIKYHHQFFNKSIQNKWHEIVNNWKSLATDYPVDRENMNNWVYQVMEDLGEFIINHVNTPSLHRPLIHYYTQASRREYKRITAEIRQSNRINQLISKLMPAWRNIVGQLQTEWYDPTTNSLKLMNRIIQRLDPYISQTTNNNQQLSMTIRKWFVKWTKQKIDDSRN